MSIESDLEIVNKYQKEIKLISMTINLLEWDQQTHMPSKGSKTRGEKMALFSGLAHEKRNANEFFNAVERLRKGDLKGDDKVMIERLHYDLVKARKLPKELVEEIANVSSNAFRAWIEAREKKDFAIFRPFLKKLAELARKQAKLIGLPGHIYNSLLDDYEQGMSVEKLKPRFEELKKGLIEILRKIESTKEYKEQKEILLKKEFSKEFQMELAKDVVRRIGLEEVNSNINFAEHPFMATIGKGDHRITTNIREDPLFSFCSSIHEAGHALYELGMPQEHFYNSLGSEPSLGIHESQSRFWENMIGLGIPFWKFYFPKFDKLFGLEENFEQWYKETNMVWPGKIRVEADEVHYCLHIILRFELELGLLEGSIQVKDLPELWNKKMKEYFGVNIENDKEGVLQDIHWSHGGFGYFSTYALGSIYADQLYRKMKTEIQGIENEIEKGEFSEIGKWLKEKVHKHGKKHLAEDLIKNICGEGLNIKVYLEYLDKKYKGIYKY